MICPKCSSEMRCIDSRDLTGHRRRSRRCVECRRTVTTYEIPIEKWSRVTVIRGGSGLAEVSAERIRRATVFQADEEGGS